MRVSDLIGQAVRNILRKKLRTALTMSGISIGCMTVVLVVSISAGIENLLTSQLKSYSNPASMLVQHKGGFSGMKMMNTGLRSIGKLPREVAENEKFYEAKFITQEEVRKIRTLEHVISVKQMVAVPINSIRLRGQKKRFETFQMPWSEEEPLELSAGAAFTSSDAPEIILTPEYAEVFGLPPGDLVGMPVAIELGQPINNFVKMLTGMEMSEPPEVELTIRGFTKPGIFSTFAWIPEQTTKKLASTTFRFPKSLGILEVPLKSLFSGEHDIMMAKVIVDDPANVAGVRDVLQKKDFDVTSQEDMLGALEKVFNTVTLALSAFAMIALAVALLGIANTLIMAANERRREIAVMMALGATRGMVRKLFAAEAGTIAFWGGVAALAAGNLIGVLANQFAASAWPEIWSSYNIFLPRVWLIPAILLGSTVLGLAAGLYPAYLAGRQDPIEVLRYN